MRHGSLFSGIGGFDLAAEWMGWENIFHCEINPFCQKVLKYYWPNSTQYHDITKTDFTIHRGQIDILTGGFPCQPYSAAGKRLGKEDSRHLWPKMLRVIREVAPKYIVGENVFGLLNWNGGMVFDEVHSDLESEGYEVQAVVIPAAAVNAPHGRDRVWFVAYLTDTKLNGLCDGNQTGHIRSKETTPCGKGGEVTNAVETNGNESDATDSDITRLDKQHISTKSNKSWPCCRSSYERGDFSRFPTQSPICGRNDGISSEMDGITFSKWRNESIRGYGNAVVPQVVYQIFKAIEQTRIKQHEKKD